MSEWEAMQNLDYKEMEDWTVGTRVKLRFLKQVPPGEIIEVKPPYGLLSPKFRCRWDNGDKSGWLSAGDLTKINIKNGTENDE